MKLGVIEIHVQFHFLPGIIVFVNLCMQPLGKLHKGCCDGYDQS